MSSYTTKNYTEAGGDRTIIGGVLEIKEGAEVTGLPQMDFLAESTASTVKEAVADLNTLISGLKAAGIMKRE